MKDCIDGKYGVMADGVKVVVVSFQEIPGGICPYLTVAGYTQTVMSTIILGSRL